jgi:hypothetical protein
MWPPLGNTALGFRVHRQNYRRGYGPCTQGSSLTLPELLHTVMRRCGIWLGREPTTDMVRLVFKMGAYTDLITKGVVRDARYLGQ